MCKVDIILVKHIQYLKETENLDILGIICFIQDNPNYDPSRCSAFQCDITNDDLSGNVPQDSVDVVSMIFVLSAIHPDKMEAALSNIIKARALLCTNYIYNRT